MGNPLNPFSAPAPPALDGDLLSMLMQETISEAAVAGRAVALCDRGPRGAPVAQDSFEGLYAPDEVAAQGSDTDATGYLVDVQAVLRKQVRPTLPDASEFSQAALRSKPGMEWLATVDAVLIAPHAEDPASQRAQLAAFADALRAEASVLDARFFPRVPDYVPSRVLGVDTETTGLDLRTRYGQDGRIATRTLLVGLTLAPTPYRGYYLPVRNTGDDGVLNWNPEVLVAWLGDLLQEFVAVYHNAAYDLEVLALNGMSGIRGWPYVLDTQICDYVTDVNEKTHGLKAASARRLGRRMIEIAELFVGFGGLKKTAYIAFADLSASQALVYAASDSMNTLGLLDSYLQAPEDDNIFLRQPIPMAVDHQLIDVIRNMLRTGLPVNYEYYYYAMKDAIFRQFALQQEIDRVAGREINVGSRPQLVDLLFRQFAVPVLPGMRLSADGSPSLDEEAIDKLHEAYPEVTILNLIVRYRKLVANTSKIYAKAIANSYSDAYLPWLRLNLSFTQTGTATGRLASSSNRGKEAVSVNDGGRKFTYKYEANSWDAGINAQGVPAGPFRSLKSRALRALPPAAGVDPSAPYPAEVERRFLAELAKL